MEGVEALAQVVGAEGDRGSADLLAVEGKRSSPRVGEQGRAPVAPDHFLLDLDAGGVLGLEQGVQMAARHVGLGVDAAEAQAGLGPQARAEEGDALRVVGVEEPAHAAGPELESGLQVGGVDVAHPGHDGKNLRGRYPHCKRSTVVARGAISQESEELT